MFDIKRFTDYVMLKCQNLIELHHKDNQDKCVLAYQRFNEYLIRVNMRYKILCDIEDEMKIYIPGDPLKRTLDEMQQDFVDKIEAFHQHIYSTIAAFIMCLNYNAPQSFVSQLPVNSIDKFLKYISEKAYSSTLKTQINELCLSVDFRNKFIDHPQQHALHTWMTYSYYGNASVVIYYIQRGREVYAFNGSTNPYHPDFKPPVNYESFYVAPYHKKVFMALIAFIKAVLRSLISA